MTRVTYRRVLMLGAVALLAVGCGSAANKTSGGGPSQGQAAADAYKFSACVRDHGVEGFPDPVVNSSPGHESIGIRVTPATSGSPAFKTAQKKCQGLMPQGGPTTQAQSHAPLRDELGFAACMRGRGYTDFPDPNSQGQLSLQMMTAAGIDLHAPALRTAALACVPASHGALTRAAVEQALSQGGGGTGSGTSTGPSSAP
jgi:hypothetical protein